MFGLSVKMTSLNNEDQTGVIIAIRKPDTDKKWRIHFRATDWFADSEYPVNFKLGDVVRVLGNKTSTTLLIEPI